MPRSDIYCDADVQARAAVSSGLSESRVVPKVECERRTPPVVYTQHMRAKRSPAAASVLQKHKQRRAAAEVAATTLGPFRTVDRFA